MLKLTNRGSLQIDNDNKRKVIIIIISSTSSSSSSSSKDLIKIPKHQHWVTESSSIDRETVGKLFEFDTDSKIQPYTFLAVLRK